MLAESVELAGGLSSCELEPPWNPARLEQRVGRVHRFGQTQARTSDPSADREQHRGTRLGDSPAQKGVVHGTIRSGK